MPLYSDINLGFEVDPASKDLIVLTDEEAVKQSVRNLVRTAFYERPFQPAIGGASARLLFEPMDDVTKNLLAGEIHNTLSVFEPRVTVKLVEFREDLSVEPHLLEINVSFEVLNLPNLVTTTVILRRIR